MKKRMTARGAATRALALMLAIAPALAAQNPNERYPVRPIRLIVQFAPGGNVDTAARAVGQQMTQQLGQQIVLDNRPGANGSIGVQLVADAPADGYTLGIGFIGNLATNPHIFDKLPYDPLKDFTPISRTADAPNLLAIHPGVPATTLAALVAHAKANPGRVAYGTGGVGTVNHLAGELLARRAGIALLHVPYKGSGQAVTDVVGGNIQMIFGGPPSLAPHVRSGRLKALAITTAKRSPAFPELPTVAESGYPGFEAIAWMGIVGPAGMPQAVVERLNVAIRKALATDDVKRLLSANGFEITPSSPSAFAQFIRSEHAAWGKLIREINLRPR